MSSFTPIDLNERNVNKIFKQCLATSQTQKPICCVLFQKEKGFPQDSRPIFFDGDILEEAKPIIEFILGQLKAVHQKEPSITTTSVKTTYQNIDWTSNKNLVIALLHLSTATNLISPIDAKTANMDFLKELFPTLSLDDPNYPSWEKQNILTLKKLYIEGKAENDERNLINNKSDAMLEAAFAANIIMTPELVDNMIQNYSSLSFEERDALWSKALTMDRKTLTSLREAHNKKIMEYAEKADPETAKKLMETVVENEDKAATADALEDGKKSAKVDIVERINNQLKSKELDFDSILMKIAASLNVSYVPGMDLNTLPLNMLQRVSRVLEIIEKRVSEHRMEGKPLDDINIPLDF